LIRKLRFAFLFYFWLIDLRPKESLNAMKDLAGLAGPAGLAGRAGGEMPEIFCSELARSAGPAGLAGKAGGGKC